MGSLIFNSTSCPLTTILAFALAGAPVLSVARIVLFLMMTYVHKRYHYAKIAKLYFVFDLLYSMEEASCT